MKRAMILTAGLMILAACYTRNSLMTMERFDDINIGTPISEVTAKVGEPYSIRSRGGGVEEYEYIERIEMRDVVQENHYFIIVSNGQVVGKLINRQRPPAYDLIYQEDPNYTNY
jgi:hypothetical protein